jgi:hypothetical protein
LKPATVSAATLIARARLIERCRVERSQEITGHALGVYAGW